MYTQILLEVYCRVGKGRYMPTALYAPMFGHRRTSLVSWAKITEVDCEGLYSSVEGRC